MNVKGGGSECEHDQDRGVVTLVIQGIVPNDTVMPDKKCGKRLENISYLSRAWRRVGPRRNPGGRMRGTALPISVLERMASRQLIRGWAQFPGFWCKLLSFSLY